MWYPIINPGWVIKWTRFYLIIFLLKIQIKMCSLNGTTWFTNEIPQYSNHSWYTEWEFTVQIFFRFWSDEPLTFSTIRPTGTRTYLGVLGCSALQPFTVSDRLHEHYMNVPERFRQFLTYLRLRNGHETVRNFGLSEKFANSRSRLKNERITVALFMKFG